MKVYINAIGLSLLFSSIFGLLCTARADELPDFKLIYRELTQRKELLFSKGGTKYTKPVGMMNWEFPATSFATIGFEPNLKTYSIQPLVPVTNGTEYAFRIDQFGEPKDFNLPNTEDGIKKAKRLVKFVRELYGKYYEETLKDQDVAGPAFQLALWETLQESEVPEGPAPFDIYKGDFRVEYPKDRAPAYVLRAESYLSTLTGDDSAFTENRFFAGQELVRLTGLKSGTTAAAQSQLALRNRGGVSNGFNTNQPISAGANGGSGGFGPAGTRSGGVGGFGGIGGGGGFIGTGGGTAAISGGGGTDSGNPSNPGPITPGGGGENPGGGGENPGGGGENPGGGGENPGGGGENPGGGGGDNNPIPAPPAAILGILAIAILSGRKLLASANRFNE